MCMVNIHHICYFFLFATHVLYSYFGLLFNLFIYLPFVVLIENFIRFNFLSFLKHISHTFKKLFFNGCPGFCNMFKTDPSKSLKRLPNNNIPFHMQCEYLIITKSSQFLPSVSYIIAVIYFTFVLA